MDWTLFLALGETGIGKSTLMDTLFNTNFENFESSHFEPEVKLRAQTYDLHESNVRLRLTVVNTVGFGDQMNKQERWERNLLCVWRLDVDFQKFLHFNITTSEMSLKMWSQFEPFLTLQLFYSFYFFI